MRRFLCALAVGLFAVVANAHAPYIVTSADGKVTVVFSDDLNPDAKIKAETWKKMSGLKLTTNTGEAVAWTQDEHCLTATAPAGTKVLQGVADYGVYQKGDAKPMFIKFYPKAILGGVPTDGGKTDVPLQVVPKVEAGKVRFQVLLAGQPLKAAKVSVMLPEPNGEKMGKQEATTDDTGFTPGFEGVGRFAATVRHAEEKSGEADGKKYDGINHVATLVVDVK